ncbi:indole-3-glycerol phosphate synthase TrpC [Paracoccaceae bacterium GXU_MW_L88]
MSILQKIRDYKLEEVAAAKAELPEEQLREAALAAPAPRGFREALMTASKAGGYGLIAEIKKASPSKGLIREDFDPASLAEAYKEGGATCLSVLTDAPSFQGAPEFLREARAAVDLPILRKDFMYDPYQVAEARAWGADAILLILASLSDDEARALIDAAKEMQLDCLFEVHTLDEMHRAEKLGADMIGINNRDLNSFETDIRVTKKLAGELPADTIAISESGLSTRRDLTQLAKWGIRCFLIGESLMRQDDVARATEQLLASPWSPEGE